MEENEKEEWEEEEKEEDGKGKKEGREATGDKTQTTNDHREGRIRIGTLKTVKQQITKRVIIKQDLGYFRRKNT